MVETAMPPTSVLLLAHATVLSGSGPAQPDIDVLVVGDRIAEVGPHLVAPAGARVLDLSGMYLLPGLVDAHVHLMTIPGEPYLGLDDPSHDALIRAQLRSYLACGVTTVLDAASHPARMAEIRGWIDAGNPAPRVLSLGRALDPSGGYPGALDPSFPGLASPADVGPALDEAVSLGAIGVKITFESGFGNTHDPTFDAPMRETLVAGAAARQLPIYVHAMTPTDHIAASDLHPWAYMHGPETPSVVATREIAATGAFVVTTLTVYDANRLPMDRDALADPLLRIAVPPRELAAALDRGIVRQSREDIAALAVPWAPAWAVHSDGLARWIAGKRLAHAERAVRLLYEAGVPLVLGTDSGTWPFIQGQFHGWAAIRELELLGESGLSPEEAIAAATTVPARMLGLESEIGRVEPGMAADLVVLASDPRASLSAFRAVRWTVRAGEAHTPAEWMGR
jgi:imidazolonepropionase-like amidohydrolase